MNTIHQLKTSLAILALVFFATSLKATNHPLIVFSADNFRGESISIYGDWSINHRHDYWNDAINSIIVPRGYEAQLFEHTRFQGNYLVVRGEWSSRSDTYWCNRVSSIRLVPIRQQSAHGHGHGHHKGRGNGHRHHQRERQVHTCGPACGDNCGYQPAPIITVFEHSNFRGAAQEVQGEWSVYDHTDFWNDRISSIYIPRGYAVILYEHDHFRGHSVIIEGPWNTQSSQDFWNDRVSSIRVVRR